MLWYHVVGRVTGASASTTIAQRRGLVAPAVRDRDAALAEPGALLTARLAAACNLLDDPTVLGITIVDTEVPRAVRRPPASADVLAPAGRRRICRCALFPARHAHSPPSAGQVELLGAATDANDAPGISARLATRRSRARCATW